MFAKVGNYMGCAKVNRSNAAHKRLAEHYLDISCKPKSSKEAFEAYVKHNYHYEVKAIQKKECRVLSRKEKALIYRNNYKTLDEVKAAFYAATKNNNTDTFAKEEYRRY